MCSSDLGVSFETDAGWIFVYRSRIEASEEKLLTDPLPAGATRLYVSENHTGNFIDCLRNRKSPICTATVGHRSATVCHIGNISLRLGGRKLVWDAVAERFRGDDEANRMLDRPLRGSWKL